MQCVNWSQSQTTESEFLSLKKKVKRIRTFFADNNNFFEVGIILRDYGISD